MAATCSMPTVWASNRQSLKARLPAAAEQYASIGTRSARVSITSGLSSMPRASRDSRFRQPTRSISISLQLALPVRPGDSIWSSGLRSRSWFRTTYLSGVMANRPIVQSAYYEPLCQGLLAERDIADSRFFLTDLRQVARLAAFRCENADVFNSYQGFTTCTAWGFSSIFLFHVSIV